MAGDSNQLSGVINIFKIILSQYVMAHAFALGISAGSEGWWLAGS